MFFTKIHYKWRTLWLVGIVSLAILLSSCGGAASSAVSSTPPQNAQVQNASTGGTASNQQKSPSGPSGSQTSATSFGPQYQIKSLNVSMEVKDTRKVADEIQTWISGTDSHAFSTGVNYTTVGDNLFNISMNFAVQATLYPQVARYLRDYPSQQQGRLTAFTETVQDVTNDYVDTVSRLKNLQTEQGRLLDLMNHAQVLGDVLTVEQKLTDVEGQIESMEAHLKSLNGQVAYYNISISLQPIDTAPPPPTSGWNLNGIFHDAFASSLAFAQWLLTVLIWLFAYSFYIIPTIIIIWLIVRWRNSPRRLVPSHMPPASTNL